MKTIKKPDANPIAALLLTMFLLQTGHVIINGQSRKWLFIFLSIIIGYVLCCIPGLVVIVCSWIESYQTAERLQKGEEIGENEYTLELLYKIVSKLDSTATHRNHPPAP